MTATTITLADVSKRFGTQQALDRVSLAIGAGESVVVLGPSGCGKTTMLRMIAGLDVPDRGEVAFNGVVASAAGCIVVPPHDRRVGFVFQDLALWPHLTVQAHLAFVLGSARVSRQMRSQRIHDTLALVRIERFATRYPHQLSGGEQQRVALARALVGEPRVVLLDEPFSSLDRDLRAELRLDLVRLQRALMLTMVYVTHDREDAVVLADQIAEMGAGRVVAVEVNHRRGPQRA